MYSAFGIEHGEFSKSAKLGLVRPKVHLKALSTEGKPSKEIVHHKGTWALNEKRKTTIRNGDKTERYKEGGGLTPAGTFAAIGGAEAGFVGGTVAYDRHQKAKVR